MPERWTAAMQAFYRELAEELAAAAPECAGCGSCCRFDEAGHVLYASGLERRYLAVNSPPAPHPDAEASLLGAGLRCPYQEGGRCTAREGKVLGCRLHFCRWEDPLREEEVYARWHGRLKRLHEELGEAWDYRPLLPLDWDM